LSGAYTYVSSKRLKNTIIYSEMFKTDVPK
jgi:hypothetical protein